MRQLTHGERTLGFFDRESKMDHRMKTQIRSGDSIMKHKSWVVFLVNIVVLILGGLGLGIGVPWAFRLRNQSTSLLILFGMALGVVVLGSLVQFSSSRLLPERRSGVTVVRLATVLMMLPLVVALVGHFSSDRLDRYSRGAYWACIVIVGLYVAAKNVRHLRH